jgi:toxin YoeB
MKYEIKYMPEAINDIAELKRTDIQAYMEVHRFIRELHKHPRTGTGKPELMKYDRLKGLWSRRITDNHRLVYSIRDKEIVVLLLPTKGHYGDK